MIKHPLFLPAWVSFVHQEVTKHCFLSSLAGCKSRAIYSKGCSVTFWNTSIISCQQVGKAYSSKFLKPNWSCRFVKAMMWCAFLEVLLVYFPCGNMSWLKYNMVIFWWWDGLVSKSNNSLSSPPSAIKSSNTSNPPFGNHYLRWSNSGIPLWKCSPAPCMSWNSSCHAL